MKKTTSALAIAALLSTGAASAATFQLDDNNSMTVYGGVYFAGSNVEQGDGTTESDIFDNGTTLGFDFTSEMSNGLTAFARLEEDGFDMVDGGTGGYRSADGNTQFTDEAYAGIRGDFGSVQFGRDDSLYDNMIGDYFNYQEVFTPTTYGPTKQRALKFVTTAIDGFTFGAEAQINGDFDESLSATTVNGEDPNGNTADSVSLAGAARYTSDAVTVTGSIDQRGNDAVGAYYVDSPIYGLAAAFDLSAVGITTGYQTFEFETANGTVGTDILSVDGRYTYGPGDVYGTYQQVDQDNVDERDEVVLGANYSFSKFYGFVEYIAYDRDQDAGDAVSVGGGYTF